MRNRELNNLLQKSLTWVTHDKDPVLIAVMLAKTYEAFKDAGASDEKAREAAEEMNGRAMITGFENRAGHQCITLP